MRFVATILLLAVVSADPSADDILNNVTVYDDTVVENTTVWSVPTRLPDRTTTNNVVTTTPFDALEGPPTKDKESGKRRSKWKTDKNEEGTYAHLVFIIAVPVFVIVLILIAILVFCISRSDPKPKPTTSPSTGTGTGSAESRQCNKTQSVKYTSLPTPNVRLQPESSKAPQSSTNGSSEMIRDLPVEPAPGGPDLSPVNIPANKFTYKGPLVIDKRTSAEVDKTHVLDDPKLNARTPKDTDHVRFSDRLNEVYEIGSEVEVVIGTDGKPKLTHQAPKSEENTESSWKIFMGDRKAKLEQNVDLV